MIILLGLALAADFRGIAKRMHEREQRRHHRGFLASYNFQRLFGAAFALAGLLVLVPLIAELVTD